ncbi:MAG: hypothetical protein Q9P01_08290 [Anaerolineae bacterium]|nr:hypothetical protein [Anaerolineae bacterium]MDQ7034823.1 hypothetical protein [Anaerolineae bacterium]
MANHAKFFGQDMSRPHILLLIILLNLILAACQSTPQQGEVTVLPTVPTIQGTVNITTPANGSIIYAESLWLAGESDNVPDDGFKIRVVTAEDELLAETTVQPQNGQWLIELVHGYTGDPTEVLVYALPVDERITQDYDIATILISSLEQRPEGVFGQILSPQNNDTPGGDEILVVGSASGVFENQFTLAMFQPDGTEISSVGVTMTNPYFVDDMVWEASLPTNGYTGPATIRAFTIDILDNREISLGEVDVMVSRIAG